MNKILFIGPIPPPFGGVSIHILRLSQLLQNEFDIKYIDESKKNKEEYLNIRKLNLFRYLSYINKSDIISIHSGNSKLRYFHIMSGLAFRKKIILTIHAYPQKKNFFLNNLDKIILNRCDKIILVSREILPNIKINEHKLIIQHAFIPPNIAEEKELPPSLKNKITQLKSSGKIIICGNASRLDRYKNEDLYGVDLCLCAANKFKEDNIEGIIIFNVAEIDKYQEAYDNFQNQIKYHNLQNFIYLFSERISFIKLMELSDIIIRPTNTDGDSLTVREAIFLNKPIIASDIVKRPEGTIIFKNRDIEDFTQKIIKTIDLVKSKMGQILYQDNFSYSNFYKYLFRNLLK